MGYFEAPPERLTEQRSRRFAAALIILTAIFSSPPLKAADSVFHSLLTSVQQVRGQSLDQGPGDPELDLAPFSTPESTVRFLSQASFGGTPQQIEDLVGSSVSAWLRAQFAAAPSDYIATLESYQAELDFLLLNPWNRQATTFAFWHHSIGGEDQLRQRMAFALSQILVISNADEDLLTDYPEAVAYHQALLTEFGFGSYRDLLEAVTYSPGMGFYLTYRGNQKADPETGRQPDENYAREILQLFTTGLIDLNDDGTPAYPQGADDTPVELYDNGDITGLARVFTGLDLDITRAEFLSDPESEAVLTSFRSPMVVYPEYHSTAEKTFLGLTIPENTPAEESITLALDHLMGIASVGPFLSRQLIQRFTTSDPSPDYTARVTRTFNEGRFTLPDGSVVGAGRRGDLKATICAVLLDQENLQPENVDTYGKLREPVLRFTQWARAFNVGTLTPEYTLELYDLSSKAFYSQDLAQHPFRAPSVFNFYRPGYVAPVTESGAAGMTVPELQITNAATIPAYLNFITYFATGGTRFADLSIYREISGLTGVEFEPELARTSFVPDYSYEETLAGDLPVLFDHLNVLLANGALHEDALAAFIELVEGVPSDAGDDDWRSVRVGLAVTLVMTATDYLILR